MARVVLAGGGSAGHVEPALATAAALRRLAPDSELTLLGTARGIESRLVPAHGYPLALIPAVPLPRRPGRELLEVPGRLVDAVRAAGAVLDRVQADVVVGFGGYVALPAYLAARRRRLPLVVHEANARPGLANRVGARLTRRVATAGPTVRLPHAVATGIPIRRELVELDRAAERVAARAGFGLAAAAPTLLVVGGSQGAQRLNNALLEAADELLAAGAQVLHIAGPAHAPVVRSRLPTTAGPGYVVVGYVEEMAAAYAAADLVLCRAGAMTCAELALLGLPGVYVPLPIGNGEQRLNALPVVRAGGGVLVPDRQLTGAWLRGHLVALLGDRARLAAMGAVAARFGYRAADEALARMVLDAAEERR
ncbi:MAG TPA: undecaprenyldiphospho-muramoylpentapeptide beta-N-acetylglucosaminyltransferase [Mycobacteriales bacterium]|nr:undecaprenyldiphospho-muramoylpentapeptide beta-N-acetylglucosaminyltransferase [Mycobacteriales bacterium]